MIGVGGAFRVMRLDDSVTSQKVKPGTIRRISRLAKQYRWSLVLLLTVTALDSVLTVANPLLLGIIVDRGILPHRPVVIMALSLTIAALAVIDALAVYVQSWTAARIGEGLVYNLRTEVFKHVLQQPVAFFARSQTGALVSRLNTDVIGAQQAVIALFAQILSTILTLALVLTTLFLLSWPITAIALVVIPLFILPGKMIGRRLQRLSREEMKLDADLGSMMNERFNVAGAMLAKLYGRQDEESGLFARCAGRVRDIAIVTALYGRIWLPR